MTTGGQNPKKLKRVYASEAEAQQAANAVAGKGKRGAFTFDYDLYDLAEPATGRSSPRLASGRPGRTRVSMPSSGSSIVSSLRRAQVGCSRKLRWKARDQWKGDWLPPFVVRQIHNANTGIQPRVLHLKSMSGIN